MSPQLVFPDEPAVLRFESTQELAESLEDWVAENTDASAYPPIELRTQQQDFPPLWEALPIVSCLVRSDTEQQASAEFPIGYQQARIQALVCELMILAEAEPAWTANNQLYAIVDELKAARRMDGTLNGRVETTSPLYSVTYDGEVNYEDGTLCRMATFRLVIGQRVEAR